MAKENSPITVLAIVDLDKSWKQIKTALLKDKKYNLLEAVELDGKITQTIHETSPDVIFIGLSWGDQTSLKFIDETNSRHPNIALIAILDEDQNDLIQSVMLAGARGFISHPFNQTNLLKTLERVNELQTRTVKSSNSTAKATTKSESKNTVAVFSPRGGAGCTLISSNLALGLLEKSQQRVILVDGKQYFGHLDVIFNLRSRNSIADLIQISEEIDQNIIKDVVESHVSGLDILLGPNSFSAAQSILPEALFNVLVNVRRSYNYTVIDAGNSLSDNTVTLLDMATNILVVLNPDLASLRDVSEFNEIIQSLNYPPSKIHYVLNNSDMIGGISKQYIEDALKIEFLEEIPEDRQAALLSINRGVPLLFKDPEHKISQSIYKIAEKVMGMSTTVPLKATNSSNPVPEDALSKSSRLG